MTSQPNPKCPTCKGSGKVGTAKKTSPGECYDMCNIEMRKFDCPECGGTGTVQPPKTEAQIDAEPADMTDKERMNLTRVIGYDEPADTDDIEAAIRLSWLDHGDMAGALERSIVAIQALITAAETKRAIRELEAVRDNIHQGTLLYGVERRIKELK